MATIWRPTTFGQLLQVTEVNPTAASFAVCFVTAVASTAASWAGR